jgi:phosphoglycerate dehydrogenase-like enzyme
MDAALPRLKVIGRAGIGVDTIDVPAASARGIVVMNTPFGNSITTAEHAIAMLFALAREIPQADQSTQNGKCEKNRFIGVELAGKTLGLIGLGRIGRAVARRAKAFDMRVIAVTRTPCSNVDHLDAQGSMQELDAMMPRCDFLAVTCPLNEETRGMIDARRLALCKPHLVVINVARAAVLDEAALYLALRDRIIAGAVLDVWYAYPTAAQPAARPSRFPFHELANVIMTPHCSAWTDGLIERRWRFIASNLDRLARGEPLQNVVLRPRVPAQS